MAGKGFISINLIANTERFKQGFKKAQGALGAFGNAVNKYSRYIGIVLTGALVAAGRRAIMAAAEFETLRVSFTTLTGSAKTAKETIQGLTEFTAKTPFQLNEVAGAAKQLLAAGVAAKDLQKELKTLGDLAAVTNVPLTDMAQIYSKAMNKGKLQAEELNQLSERGIPIMQELSEMFGKTKMEIFELASKGLIGFNELQIAMDRMTGSGGMAEGAMEKLSKTSAGLYSTFKDNLNITLARLGDYVLPLVNDGLSRMIKLMNTPKKEMLGNLLEREREEYEIMKRLQSDIEQWKKHRDDPDDGISINERAFQRELERYEDLKKSYRETVKERLRLQDEINAAEQETANKTNQQTESTGAAYEQFLAKLEKINTEEKKHVETIDEKIKKFKEQRNAVDELTAAYVAQSQVLGMQFRTLPYMSGGDLSPMAEPDDEVMAEDSLWKQMDQWEKMATSIDVAKNALSSFGDVYSAVMSNNMMALNAQHEAEIKAFEEKNRGATDYNEKLRELQEKQRKERNKELTKQARVKQMLGLFQAMMNVPLAISQGTAIGGPPLGAIYGALASAQVAAIAAMKPPSFKIGTTGFKGGAAILHPGETLTNLPAGTQVISKGMSKMRQPEGKAKIRLEKDEVVIALNKIMAEYKYKL